MRLGFEPTPQCLPYMEQHLPNPLLSTRAQLWSQGPLINGSTIFSALHLIFSSCAGRHWQPFAAIIMSWVSGAIDTVKHAFDLYFNRENECHFLQIPQDVFVDDIFPYLLIDDLLELRKVCNPNYCHLVSSQWLRSVDVQRIVPFDAPSHYLEAIHAQATSSHNSTPPNFQVLREILQLRDWVSCHTCLCSRQILASQFSKNRKTQGFDDSVQDHRPQIPAWRQVSGRFREGQMQL